MTRFERDLTSAIQPQPSPSFVNTLSLGAKRNFTEGWWPQLETDGVILPTHSPNLAKQQSAEACRAYAYISDPDTDTSFFDRQAQKVLNDKQRRKTWRVHFYAQLDDLGRENLTTIALEAKIRQAKRTALAQTMLEFKAPATRLEKRAQNLEEGTYVMQHAYESGLGKLGFRPDLAATDSVLQHLGETYWRKQSSELTNSTIPSLVQNKKALADESLVLQNIGLSAILKTPELKDLLTYLNQLCKDLKNTHGNELSDADWIDLYTYLRATLAKLMLRQPPATQTGAIMNTERFYDILAQQQLSRERDEYSSDQTAELWQKIADRQITQSSQLEISEQTLLAQAQIRAIARSSLERIQKHRELEALPADTMQAVAAQITMSF